MRSFSLLAALCFFLLAASACTDNEVSTGPEAEPDRQALEQTMREANDQIFGMWTETEMNELDALLAPNFQRYSNGELVGGVSEMKSLMEYFRVAFPDVAYDHEIQVIDDHRVFTSWSARGTHEGNFGDVPPTGKSIETHGMTVLTFDDDGKIVEDRSYFNEAAILNDLGYTITPPSTESK
ncbi:ester cyclase [Lewinella sp. JB7]|uniref:ester cyclase n=1 Tax=Lewinella sp. JB7 TaxID=2962887 RepID=UPI0020C9C0FC|nr:ester cyclase [Lewinella sp. JB7]MCP9234842.1 ester cyclase [Lewinella sp. JB7]